MSIPEIPADILAAAMKAAWPGLPGCMTLGEAERRTRAALGAAYPHLVQPGTPRTSIADQIRALKLQLEALTRLQSELGTAAGQVQDAIVFATHPELVDLDGELDNCYPDLDS